MMDTDHNVSPLGYTSISPDDVTQELALLRLQNPGKRYSRRLVRQRMALRQEPTFDISQGADTAMPWQGGPEPIVDEAVIEQLITWTLELGDPTVSALIFSFLENPEDELERTIRELSTLGYLTETRRRLSKPDDFAATLSNLMWRSLPATKERLIDIITQSSLTTERPAATVRQWLRRYERKGTLRRDTDGLYHDNRQG